MDAVIEYIEDLYKEDELNHDKYIDQTELKNFVPVIDQDVSRMIKLIINMTKPLRILEIGTSIGFSTVTFANEIKNYGGKITTIEIDEKIANQAMTNFKRNNLDNYINLIVGDACKILPDMDEQYDLIFQDVGGKKLYPLLFNDCIRLLKEDGILLSEDTLFAVDKHKELFPQYVKPINEFNNLIAKNKSLKSTILPIGDGLTIAIKESK